MNLKCAIAIAGVFAAIRAAAADFPSPVLRKEMLKVLEACTAPEIHVVRRKAPFFAEVSLVSMAPPNDDVQFMPYVTDYNKRDRFALGIGTRPHSAARKKGTMLYFAVGTENPKGFSTGGVGFFVPTKNLRATIDWRDYADGTLAIVTFDGKKYRLVLKQLQKIPE